jgi:hypothetical protein
MAAVGVFLSLMVYTFPNGTRTWNKLVNRRTNITRLIEFGVLVDTSTPNSIQPDAFRNFLQHKALCNYLPIWPGLSEAPCFSEDGCCLSSSG